MDFPDLSRLSEAEKQDLIIKLLFDNKALMALLMEREATRMAASAGMPFERARDYLIDEYKELRLGQWELAGVAPTTVDDEPSVEE